MTTYAARRYRPRHVRETITVNGRLVSCSESALAMYADAVTLGEVIVSQQTIRAMSSEPRPDPSSPGLNLDQLDAVAAKLRIDLFVRTGSSWDQLVAWLREGRRAIVQLQLAELGGGRVGHAMYVTQATAAGVVANDPLRTAESTYDPARFRRAMTTFARETGVATGLRFAISRKVPNIAVPV